MLDFTTGWYAILPSKQLPVGKPLSLKRFGHELVLWRDTSGNAVAMQDRCPHRGAKLSIGKLCDNDSIQCPYHGYRFNADGNCKMAPEFDKAIPGLTVKTFFIKEAMDMLWLYWGESPQLFDYAELESIHRDFRSKYSSCEKLWHSPLSYCVENQLDYTHLRFVHHNTIGRDFKMPDQPHVECDNSSIRITLNQDQASLIFFFPNCWILNISNKMKVLLYFAPVDSTHTRLYLRTYRKFLTLPIIKFLADPLFNLSNRIILKQDQRIVSSQGLAPSYQASKDTLLTHDKAIRYYRETLINKMD